MIMRRRLQMNGRNYQMTETMRVVLAAVVDGGGQAWGVSICERTALGTGIVYPALDKLMGAGVIIDRWEDPAPEDRPRRRFYDPAFDRSWYVTNGLLLERQLMIAERDLGDPVTAEYYADGDLDRTLPPALPDDAVVPRFGYCSECGKVFPAVTGTAEQARNALMPEFSRHRC
jgi:hypothetical protein